jgi:predicted Zn-dependent peptidase
VYSIESSYQTYSDTGFVGIYFGTEQKTAHKAKKIVLKEIDKLRTRKLGTMQLHMAKEQAIGQMAMAEENYAALMLVFGKNLLDKGKIDSLDTIFDIIRETTAEELMEIANEVFDPDQLSYLTYTPA